MLVFHHTITYRTACVLRVDGSASPGHPLVTMPVCVNLPVVFVEFIPCSVPLIHGTQRSALAVDRPPSVVRQLTYAPVSHGLHSAMVGYVG